MSSLRTMRRRSTGDFQTDVRTVLPFHVTSRGRPTFTESNRGIRTSSNSSMRLCVHPFDPLSARCGSHEWIRKVLCFPPNLVAPELHDAHGAGRLAVIGQD